VFGAPIMIRGMWGVDVRSLETGEAMFGMNGDKLMMPASNMKIVTLAAAADRLGWDHRFPTTLETTAAVAAGVLQGDLIVRGGGDPTINRRDDRANAVFDEWAAALRSAGITAIEGRVIGDDQAFDEEGLGAGWAWDYLQFGYAAPVGALQYNENVADLTVAAGFAAGEPAVVRLPPGTGLTILNRAVTGAAGTEEHVGFRRRLDGPIIEVMGSVPAGGAPATRSVAVSNPTTFFVQAVKDALAARGIEVSGDAVDLDDVAPAHAGNSNGGERRVLAVSQSPPLRDVATVLMKVSQNLYAETLLKALGAARGGLGTTAGGRAAVREILGGWGVPDDAYVVYDGSGLSRYNYVTPRAVTTILERVYREGRHKEAFFATLPIAGRDGTVASRMRRSRAEGNAVAKTGSIANVRSLSGYVRTRDRETLVFSIIANDFVIPAATVNWIADLAVEILSNFTRRR
jgi:D-alanyl-D-alanine carboxypeptidase/D-alanyl-D-alanine-endopeptidase (penicillin-binding protein 4)